MFLLADRPRDESPASAGAAKGSDGCGDHELSARRGRPASTQDHLAGCSEVGFIAALKADLSFEGAVVMELGPSMATQPN